MGAQWWLAPQLSPSGQSGSAAHPNEQPRLVGPQVHGSATQMRGTAASVAQSESELQGSRTAKQAPAQTDCPGGSQT
jgi:hypothetical protein